MIFDILGSPRHGTQAYLDLVMYHPLVRRSSGYDQISRFVLLSLFSVLFTTIYIAPQEELISSAGSR
jgi:hypothetical protein